MAFLYLTEQGSYLRKVGDRIIVKKDEKVLLDVPCHKIDAVLIFGNVQFSTQLIGKLLKQGIELALLTKNGRLKGQITSPATKNITLRMNQFDRYRDDKFRLDLSRTIVSAKIRNCVNIIKSFSYNHPEIDFDKEIRLLLPLIKKARKAGEFSTLLGDEGIAGRYYWQSFRKMILGEFYFHGRQKNPPPDPVNALLSLGYTMVYNEILSLLDGIGFDPFLGYFHQTRYGHASLASDILEEFRACVDRFTLSLINNKVFSPLDFHELPKKPGVYLSKDSLKKYFAQFEKMMTKEFFLSKSEERTNLRKCLRLQARRIADCIQGKSPYIPYNLKL
ncbi:MAG: CRISPR-associated endonuclease Cas1 [Candidatus Aminicenantes bacterium]|nr:CRISPR-associated endonuclease Cas1 [Candidatus Aminicenantes bacterium]